MVSRYLLFLSSSLFFCLFSSLFPSSSVFFFLSSRARKPSRKYIHLSVQNCKNTPCLTFRSRNPRCAQNKTGSNFKGKKISSSRFPESPSSSSSGSVSHLSALHILKSAPNQSHKVSANFEKEKLVTKHQRRGGGGVDRVRGRKSESSRVCRRCLAKSKPAPPQGLFQFKVPRQTL